MNTNEVKITITHFMLPLVVEEWCDENCFGNWTFKRSKKTIDITFEDDSDAVLFELSRYNRFIQKT